MAILVLRIAYHECAGNPRCYGPWYVGRPHSRSIMGRVTQLQRIPRPLVSSFFSLILTHTHQSRSHFRRVNAGNTFEWFWTTKILLMQLNLCTDNSFVHEMLIIKTYIRPPFTSTHPQRKAFIDNMNFFSTKTLVVLCLAFIAVATPVVEKKRADPANERRGDSDVSSVCPHLRPGIDFWRSVFLMLQWWKSLAVQAAMERRPSSLFQSVFALTKSQNRIWRTSGRYKTENDIIVLHLLEQCFVQ